MAVPIDGWVNRAETKITAGEGVSLEDLEELRAMACEPRQHLLYIWANADLITADVISWNYFGPFDAEYQFDPRHACPYGNIKEAMSDGWRIISFPKVEYPQENTHNQLGHEFILERFFPLGGGLPHTPTVPGNRTRSESTTRWKEPNMADDFRALKKQFVDTGYVLLEDWFDADQVARISGDSLAYKGISVFERASVGDLLAHPRVVDLVAYLLESPDIAISPFRFWNHLTPGGTSDGGGWHVDDTWMADRPLAELLCMYYPQDVAEDMGPTMLLPGSHRRLYTPSQTGKLGWIRGQEKLTVKAGSLAITYPSILHARAAHFSERPRSMIKYGYEIADPRYGYYVTRETYDNLARSETGRGLILHAEVRDKRDAVWNSYWDFHQSYTFQDFKHQIGVVGRALRKHLEHEQRGGPG